MSSNENREFSVIRLCVCSLRVNHVLTRYHVHVFNSTRISMFGDHAWYRVNFNRTIHRIQTILQVKRVTIHGEMLHGRPAAGFHGQLRNSFRQPQQEGGVKCLLSQRAKYTHEDQHALVCYPDLISSTF